MGESPDPETPTESNVPTIKELNRAITRLRRVAYGLAAIVGAVLVYVAVLQIQISGMNGQLDDIKEQTDKVGGFVDDLREQQDQDSGSVTTPELRHVFKMIEDSLSLLCNEFPDDSVCLQG